MKRSQLTELLANIRATLVSFFSIVMFVALGVGLFLGIQGSARALEDAANRMFEDNNFHDLEVIFPYGLTDEDLAAIKRIDGIDEVTPTYLAYPQQQIDGSGHTYVLRVLEEDVDKSVVLEGALPTKKGEIAIGDHYAARHGLAVGDTITFVHDATTAEGAEPDKDGMQYLTSDSYKIVGFVHNPNYISQLGDQLGMSDKGVSIETFGIVTKDSFDADAFQGRYPCALVRSDSMRGIGTFSDTYQELTTKYKAAIMEVGEPRATARFDEIKGAAQEKIDEAEAQIEAGEKQLEDANKAIADGEKAIADGETQLEIAIAKLENGQATYAQTKATGDDLLAQMSKSLTSLQGTYDESAANLASKEAEVARMQAQKDEYQNTVNRLERFVGEIDAIYQEYYPYHSDPDPERRHISPYDVTIFPSVEDCEETIAEYEQEIATLQADLEKAIAAGDEEDISFYQNAILDDQNSLAQYQSELELLIKKQDIITRYQAKVKEINELSTNFNNNLDTLFPDIIKALDDTFKNSSLPISNAGERIANFPQYSEVINDGWYDFTKSEADGKIELYNAGTTRAQGLIDRSNRELATIRSYTNNVKAQLDSGWAKYYETKDRLDTALANSAAQISDGQSQVSAGQQTLDQKKKELDEGKKTVEEKGKDLEEGKAQLEAAKAQVDGLTSMNWIVNSRFMTGGTIVLANILSLTKNLRVVMASLFVIVGLLVCYSALSRIVHEHIRQIGTKKALGFHEGEITMSYLGYTALAVLAGVLLGILISVFVVQGILVPKLAQNFDLAKINRVVEAPDTLLIAAIELVLLLACTWLACHSILKRSAVDLLAGETKASSTTRFYERWAIWKKLPLMTQMVINNCLSDGRRVFGTLIGVAGCTALIVTASTLDGNIDRSLTDHFGYVYDYDVTVGFSSDEDAQDEVEQILKKQGCTYTPVKTSMILMDDDTTPAFESIYVPTDEEAFAELFHLNVVPTGGRGVTQGVWISQAHAEHRGLKVGDHIDLCTVSGERYSLTIEGFFSYYLPINVIVMSPDYYSKVFEKEATPNVFLTRAGNKDLESLKESLGSANGFTSFRNEHLEAKKMSDLFKGVTSTVVAIYLALSAIMAIIVLLNLDYMFIDEKKRELITLMINGFSVHDAKAYIYRDAIVMTIVGIIVGVGVGIVMGAQTVRAVEWQSCSFIKSAYLPGCLLGAGASAVFALIMMLIALRRIPRFSLTDIARF